MNGDYSCQDNFGLVIFHKGLPDERIICDPSNVEDAQLITKALNIVTSCDCLEKLQENEPIFVLRGQDVSAPETILLWLVKNPQLGSEKFDDAISIIREMKNFGPTKAAD